MFWFVLVWLFASELYARAPIKYPPPLPSGQEQQAHILKLTQEYPWLANAGITQYLPGYVQLQQQWLAKLYGMPEFIAADAMNREALALKVQSVRYEVKNVRTLPADEIERIRDEVGDILRATGSESSLDQAIEESLNSVEKSDPRKILVGLISILPSGKNATLFQLSAEKQIDFLKANAELTDAVIAAKFQTAGHGLNPDQATKHGLLNHVKTLLQAEEKLVSLLRAKWMLAGLDEEDFSDVENMLPKVAVEDLDPLAEENVSDFEQFSKSMRLSDRVLKLLKAADRVEESKKVLVAEDLFTIQEINPELGIYRGIIGGDCSTSNSYAFPFSPMERVFLIFDNNGTPMRLYLSGTLLVVDGKPTFYLHDIAGPGLTTEIQGMALHALYHAREELGVEEMTLPTMTVRSDNAGEEPSKSPRITELINDLNRYSSQEQVAQQYQDIAIRKFLGALQNSESAYDSPQKNAKAHLFVPDAKILQSIQVRVLGKAKPNQQSEQEELGARGAFLRLLDLLAGEENPNMFFDQLGIGRPETERILGVVNNAQNLALNAYYEEMQAEFKRFDIEFSEKFLKKNARYFIFGHLRAGDATKTGDPDMRARTIQFVMETVKRGRVRDFAYELIGSDPDFFNQDQKFREYVSSIPVRGEDNLERLERLLLAGIAPELITWNKAAAVNVSQTEKGELLHLAIAWMSKTEKPSHPTPEYLRLLAQGLKNEKHESDATSLLAIEKLLALTIRDPEVLDDILGSVKREQNIQISFRAALVLLNNGVDDKKALSLVANHVREKNLPLALREKGAALLEKFGGSACQNLMDH